MIEPLRPDDRFDAVGADADAGTHPAAAPRRRRPWLLMSAIAVAAVAPAAWLGAEYALDREEIGAIEAQLTEAAALHASASGRPDEAGELAACDAVLTRASPLRDPPWYRHVGASLVEAERISAIGSGAVALRERAVRRNANRAWWTDLSAAMDAALADPARTVPDMVMRLDEFEAAAPPHPEDGGVPAEARAATASRWAEGIAALTAQQDEALRAVARAAAAARDANGRETLDAALAGAPGPEARDLNPPELAQARARLDEIAGRVRTEIALREELEASVARALSASLALDVETAAAEDARRAVDAVTAVEVPEGARFAAVRAARSEALEAAQRRAKLLDARDRDRAWVESVARRLEGARSTQDAAAALAALQDEPPGGSGLEGIRRRIDEVSTQARAAIRMRQAASRSWREELALASDLVIASRTPADLARATAALRAVAEAPARDPGSAEDAQALAAAMRTRDTTAKRIASAMTAPLAQEIDSLPDPRNPSAAVREALAASSELAALPEASDAIDRLRQRLATRAAAYQAFDDAAAQVREALAAGDIIAAARALRDARPQDANHQWMLSDMAAAASAQALDTVESLVAAGPAPDAEAAARLAAIARSEDVAASAPDASALARRMWREMRVDVDRALWNACRSEAESALAQGDSAAWEAAVARYLSEPGGAMEDAAVSARVAFRAPEVQVAVREFRWGADACLPLEPVTDISLALDGEAWSGPIATGGPRRVSRLAAAWTCTSGAPVIELVASGVAPCREPQAFAARLPLGIDERRRGAEITLPCVPIGAPPGASAHDLAVRVTPTPRWRQSIALPEWRAADATAEAPAAVPTRPESGDDAGPASVRSAAGSGTP